MNSNQLFAAAWHSCTEASAAYIISTSCAIRLFGILCFLLPLFRQVICYMLLCASVGSLAHGGNAVLTCVHALQYLECIYLIHEGSWIFPMLVAFISLSSQMGLIWVTLLQHQTMSGMLNQAGIVPIVHRGWVRVFPAWKLVPGDVVVVKRGKVTCDMVLLKGSCLVEESMLSGEVGLLEWPSAPASTTSPFQA